MGDRLFHRMAVVRRPAVGPGLALRRFVNLQTNGQDKETMKRYRAAGVDCHHSNMEVWDKQLSNWGVYDLASGATGRQTGIDAAIEKLTEDILNETVSSW